MTSWTKTLFKKKEIKHIHFGIWDNKENMFVLMCTVDESNPRGAFGGAWNHDVERFKFIPLGMMETLKRLDLCKHI